MFNWFEFTAFIWKAKGRHGTHSPFAYFLVDVVRPKKVVFENCRKYSKSERKKEIFIQKLSNALPDFEHIHFHTEKQLISEQQKQLIQIDEKAVKEDLKILHVLKLHPQSIVILPASILRRYNSEWKALCTDAHFHFSADAWYFGLLSKRPQQAKQHFLLKLT